MSVTLQNVLNYTNDEIGNYTTGNVNNDVKIRAINRAIEWVKRNLGLPTDEKIQTFWFSADQIFYDLNSDFDESLQLLYNDRNLNTPGSRWEYRTYPEIFERTGSARQNLFSITNVNGTKQLVVHGYNRFGSQTILTLDSDDNWTADDDASNIAVDTNQKYEGTGSLSFDITNATGVASIYNDNVNFDLESLFERHGYIKLWAYMTDNDIDDIAVKLFTDASNYYTITATEADDGTAFAENEWQKIGFAADDAVATGSPDPSQITKIQIEFDLGSGFTSAADFRVDQVFTAYPDKMDFIYYSSIKGTDSTGTTNKTTLTDVTDILSISGQYEDLAEPIAQRAAVLLWPQLKGDKEQYLILKNELKENMKSFARRWPRKRTQNNYYRHVFRR